MKTPITQSETPEENQERLKDNIKYFEDSCLCDLKVPNQTRGWYIVAFYEKNCTCSCNYKHLEG